VSGVLVPGHDPGDYARAVRDLIASPGRLAGLSAGAIEHAARFSWTGAVDQLMGVYTGVMNSVAAVDA
jgi:D-inositol-3-phosphate glycosyltransferase